MSDLNVFVLNGSHDSMTLITETKKNILYEIKKNSREIRKTKRKQRVIERYLDYRPHLWVFGSFVSLFYFLFKGFTDNPIVWYYVNLGSGDDIKLYKYSSQLHVALNSLIMFEYHITGDSIITEIEVFDDEDLLYDKLKEAREMLDNKQ